jgi:hypothetical protein
MSWLMLWIVVIPGGLLREPVTISHLNSPQWRRDRPRPDGNNASLNPRRCDIGLGGCEESKLSSSVHRSALFVWPGSTITLG